MASNDETAALLGASPEPGGVRTDVLPPKPKSNRSAGRHRWTFAALTSLALAGLCALAAKRHGAMRAAGVPVSRLVAGVAMGMLLDETGGGGEPIILTDILGSEDALGTMDFKVAGDAAGVVCGMLLSPAASPAGSSAAVVSSARQSSSSPARLRGQSGRWARSGADVLSMASIWGMLWSRALW